MKQLIAYGRIENGKKVYYDERVVMQDLMDLGNVTHFKETIEYGNKRTLDQNAYLFGAICKPIKVVLNQKGWRFTEYNVYKWLENRFCKVDMVNEKTGEVFETVKPFKELSTTEWDEIVMINIRDYAETKLGIYIQLPHEFYKLPEEVYNQMKRGEISMKQAVELKHERRAS